MRGRAGRWPIRSGSASTNACAPQSGRCLPTGGPRVDWTPGRPGGTIAEALQTRWWRLDRAWLQDMRILVRREKIEVGAQLCCSCSTASALRSPRPPPGVGQPQLLEARHSGARVPRGRVHPLRKDTGLARWALGVVRSTRLSPRSPSRSTCCVGCGCCCSTATPRRPNRDASPLPGCLHVAGQPHATCRRSRYLILRIPEELALGQGSCRRGQPRPAQYPDPRSSDRPKKVETGTGLVGTRRHRDDTRRQRLSVTPKTKIDNTGQQPSWAYSGHREILRRVPPPKRRLPEMPVKKRLL